MIEIFFEKFFNHLNIFDITFSIIMIYSIVQCFIKGFSSSFLSFLKWILSVVITVILTPKIQPWVNNYIESEFINSVGLIAFIFICSLFLIILMGKALNRVVTWTGLGSIDKSFGLIFGVFKGYVVSVCLYSLLNWFYPYENWGISAEDALSFNIVKKGSTVLIDEFPNNEDIINTKEQIEKI
tara:strand:+ start:571 stop:1119 length:549 start_codon:yes stop_codon:yes gene_type:complete